MNYKVDWSILKVLPGVHSSSTFTLTLIKVQITWGIAWLTYVGVTCEQRWRSALFPRKTNFPARFAQPLTHLHPSRRELAAEGRSVDTWPPPDDAVHPRPPAAKRRRCAVVSLGCTAPPPAAPTWHHWGLQIGWPLLPLPRWLLSFFHSDTKLNY